MTYHIIVYCYMSQVAWTGITLNLIANKKCIRFLNNEPGKCSFYALNTFLFWMGDYIDFPHPMYTSWLRACDFICFSQLLYVVSGGFGLFYIFFNLSYHVIVRYAAIPIYWFFLLLFVKWKFVILFYEG